MDIEITKADVCEAEELLDDLGAWLMNHTTSFGVSVIIMQGALKEIDSIKKDLDIN